MWWIGWGTNAQGQPEFDNPERKRRDVDRQTEWQGMMLTGQKSTCESALLSTLCLSVIVTMQTIVRSLGEKNRWPWKNNKQAMQIKLKEHQNRNTRAHGRVTLSCLASFALIHSLTLWLFDVPLFFAICFLPILSILPISPIFPFFYFIFLFFIFAFWNDTNVTTMIPLRRTCTCSEYLSIFFCSLSMVFRSFSLDGCNKKKKMKKNEMTVQKINPPPNNNNKKEFRCDVQTSMYMHAYHAEKWRELHGLALLGDWDMSEERLPNIRKTWTLLRSTKIGTVISWRTFICELSWKTFDQLQSRSGKKKMVLTPFTYSKL